jgi:hypothetical protein
MRTICHGLFSHPKSLFVIPHSAETSCRGEIVSVSAPTAAGRKGSLEIEIRRTPFHDIPRARYLKDQMNPFQPRESPQGPIDPVFDKFLYAQLGEEANGMQLSVLSALARQNVDPWEIAQQLTSLPREPAIRFLTPLLAHVSDGAPDRIAPEELAARLVAMLPLHHGSEQKRGFSNIEQPRAHSVLIVGYIRLVAAVALFILFTQLFFPGLSPKATAEKPMSPAASAPAPAVVHWRIISDQRQE